LKVDKVIAMKSVCSFFDPPCMFGTCLKMSLWEQWGRTRSIEMGGGLSSRLWHAGAS